MIQHIILWLVKRFNVNVIEQSRIPHGSDAVTRGARWEAFYREEGGLADHFLRVRKGYFEAAAGLGLSETDKQYEYALADRLVREIEREVQGIIATGKIEAENRAALARQQMAQIKR